MSRSAGPLLASTAAASRPLPNRIPTPMSDTRPRAASPETSSRLPDFLVVGAMKCGTTSLHYYLSCHPQIGVSTTKELNYFVGDDPPADSDLVTNWWRGEAWYASRFPGGKPVCGEVSPAYCDGRWRDVAAERIRRTVPGVRLVLLVREPLARLRSHYRMALGNLEIAPVSFAEFVSKPEYDRYRAHSRYGSQITCLLERFPREQLLVVESEALAIDREATLARIFAHLGADPSFRCLGFRRRLYVGRTRRLPNAFGRSILGSRLLRFAWDVLPFSVYEPLRDLILRPFSTATPSFDLPDAVRRHLQADFRHEIEVARRISGEPLASLGP